MTKWESKFIDFVNKYMVHIGILFVGMCALGVRFMARKYVGNDAPFELYEIPGNYHSYVYRRFVTWLLNLTEQGPFLLKMLAYVGDAGIFLLTCILMGRKWVLQEPLRVFYLLTAIMLSPVLLQSSAAGMRPDSLCICLLLVVYMAYQKKWYVAVALCIAFAALLSPAYWFVVAGAIAYYLYVVLKKKETMGVLYHVSALALVVFLVVSVVVECTHFCGFREMNMVGALCTFLYAVGPGVATLTMIAAFRKPKLRITALVLQTVFLMVIGYWQTYHTMIWVYE